MSTGRAIAVGWDSAVPHPSPSSKGYRRSERRGRDARTEAQGTGRVTHRVTTEAEKAEELWKVMLIT